MKAIEEEIAQLKAQLAEQFIGCLKDNDAEGYHNSMLLRYDGIAVGLAREIIRLEAMIAPAAQAA